MADGSCSDLTPAARFAGDMAEGAILCPDGCIVWPTDGGLSVKASEIKGLSPEYRKNLAAWQRRVSCQPTAASLTIGVGPLARELVAKGAMPSTLPAEVTRNGHPVVAQLEIASVGYQLTMWDTSPEEPVFKRNRSTGEVCEVLSEVTQFELAWDAAAKARAEKAAVKASKAAEKAARNVTPVAAPVEVAPAVEIDTVRPTLTIVREVAPMSESVTCIVVAWIETGVEVVRARRTDMGERPLTREVPIPHACVWLNAGTAEDVSKAREYAARQDPAASVYTYPVDRTLCADPIARAKRAVLVDYWRSVAHAGMREVA